MRRRARGPGRRTRMLREGLRARSSLHAAALTAAVLVVAAAVVGAVFAGGAAESIMRDSIAGAAPGTSGVRLSAAVSPDEAAFPPGDLDGALGQAPPAGRWPSFPTRIPEQTIEAVVTAQGSEVGPEPSRLTWRAGACEHLRILRGRCPRAAGEGIVSQKTVEDGGGWRVGGAFTASEIGGLRVVGIYRPIRQDDPFWFGTDYFDGGPQAVAGGVVLHADTVFVADAEFRDRVRQNVQAFVDYPIDPDAVVVGDGSGLRRTLARFQASLAGSPFTLSTGLPQVLREGLEQRGYVDRGAALVALQLVLLGTAVLFFIVLDTTHGRRREIALAKLRGQSSAAVARFALGEPLVVLLVALPIGLVLGWAAGALLGALVLRPGTPIPLPPTALAAAAAALLGAAAAAAVSVWRVLAQPVLEQWSDAERPLGRTGRGLLAGGAVITLAAAALLLLGGAAGAPTAVLVPVLLLVVAALIGVPALVVLAHRAAPRTRASGRIASFLVVRRLARSTGARRTAALLVVTLGLAVFAIGGESVLAGNRAARAEAERGAEGVLPVAPAGATDPIAAVRAVDPDGRWAMAAATWLPDAGESVSGTVLGVDPTRLDAVGLPVRGGLPDGVLARLVDARGVPAVAIRGTRLSARITTRTLEGDAAPEVLLVVRTAAGGIVRASGGFLRLGAHAYTATVPCTRGCTFVGFVWTRNVEGETAAGGTVVVRGLSAEQDGRVAALPLRTTDRAAWRAAPPVSESSDRVSVGPGGVTDVFRTESGEAGLRAATAVLPLPAVASPGGLVSAAPTGGWRVVDGNGHGVPFRPVRRTAVLPAVLGAGVAMDVTALDLEVPGFVHDASWQVWLSPSAPADAVRRLERAGLVVGSPETLGHREATLSREGPALAFSLLLALAVVAAVLAVLATAVAAGAAARARSREAAAMRLIGVPFRSVVRAAVGEQVALLAAAALLAVPAGVAAVLLVMPLVRQSASTSPVRLEDVPAALPLLLLLAAYVAGVGVVGALTGRAVVAAGDPRRLREIDA